GDLVEGQAMETATRQQVVGKAAALGDETDPAGHQVGLRGPRHPGSGGEDPDAVGPDEPAAVVTGDVEQLLLGRPAVAARLAIAGGEDLDRRDPLDGALPHRPGD